jgi:hypothetical protein
MLLSPKLLPLSTIVSLDVLHLFLGLLGGFIVSSHSELEVLPEVGIGLQRTGVFFIGISHVLPGIEDEFVLVVYLTCPSATHYTVLFGN